jgi:hypothetical protein
MKNKTESKKKEWTYENSDNNANIHPRNSENHGICFKISRVVFIIRTSTYSYLDISSMWTPVITAEVKKTTTP